MIAEKRFVICGLSRLTTRVARILVSRGAEVVVVRGNEGAELVELLPPEVALLSSAGSREETLRAAGVAGATCLLALASEDLANLRATVTAREIAPEVPVVLRAFDPTLADQLEQGLNVRRAYSVSSLAAPTFVAAALAEEVIETLYLGDTEAPICRITVRDGSPAVALTPRELKRASRCGVLARAGPDGEWDLAAEDGPPIAVGDQVLVGGLLHDVLELARLNSPLFAPRSGRTDRSDRSDGTNRSDRTPRLRGSASSHLRVPRWSELVVAGRWSSRATWLPWVAVVLLALLILAVGVFATTLELPLLDAFYFVVTTMTTTGYGDISLYKEAAWLKLFGCAVMLSGGALLAVLFSHLASVATAERLEEQMGRRAQRMQGHVIVAGLGNVGYRVTRLLTSLGLPTAVVEMTPDARFLASVRQQAVVLTGDARLPEDLSRASIGDAAVFIACTNDELANIQACLQARRLNPGIRTIARVFDDLLADRLSTAFRIDTAISSGKVAASAFVGAATGERALRTFQLSGRDYLAFRLDVTEPMSLDAIEACRAQGVRFLAFRRQNGPAQPPSDLTAPLLPGDAAIIAGPAEAMQESSPAC